MSTKLQAVRKTYRETVMDVPHFESDYDDTLENNLAIEFGPKIATQLINATSFSDTLKSALTTAAVDAKFNRETFLEWLHQERESLSSVRESLEVIHSTLDDLELSIAEASSNTTLSQINSQFDSLEVRCQDLLEARQRTIRENPTKAASNLAKGSLVDYLYDEYTFQFPALADIAQCLDRVLCLRRKSLR